MGMQRIDIKIQGWTFQQTEIISNKSLKVFFPLSFDYLNEPYTTAIVKTSSAYYSLKLQYKVI